MSRTTLTTVAATVAVALSVPPPANAAGPKLSIERAFKASESLVSNEAVVRSTLHGLTFEPTSAGGYTLYCSRLGRRAVVCAAAMVVVTEDNRIASYRREVLVRKDLDSDVRMDVIRAEPPPAPPARLVTGARAVSTHSPPWKLYLRTMDRDRDRSCGAMAQRVLRPHLMRRSDGSTGTSAVDG
jgi:hypothetical protein